MITFCKKCLKQTEHRYTVYDYSIQPPMDCSGMMGDGELKKSYKKLCLVYVPNTGKTLKGGTK